MDWLKDDNTLFNLICLIFVVGAVVEGIILTFKGKD